MTPANAPTRYSGRRQLRTADARHSDVIQVCFETTDEVWVSTKQGCPEVLELQEYVTRILRQAVPRLDDTKTVAKPPAYSLENRRTKVRCFKTERVLWARLVWWAAISGRDLKELISGVLWDYHSRRPAPNKIADSGKRRGR